MMQRACMSAAKILEAIAELRSAGALLPTPSPKAVLDEKLPVNLPAWVVAAGLLRERDRFWLYCVPDSRACATSAGQGVIHLPPGRYLIDTFDVAARACVARESAAGSPLVIGLVHTPAPLLLWIRPPAQDEFC